MIHTKIFGNECKRVLALLLFPFFLNAQIDIGSYLPKDTSSRRMEFFFQKSNPQSSDGKLNYLSSLAFIYSIDVTTLDSQQLSLYYTQKGTALSFVGQVELGKRTADSALLYSSYFRHFVPSHNDSITLKNLNLETASPVILKKVANAAMLFISEEHTSPEHRLFTYDLLSDLKDLGFEYLAVETVARSPDSMSAFSVNVGTGFYTAEPTMANLIRFAHRLGLKIIQYDCTSCTNTQEREEVAASNLFRIVERDSTSRIIVHCGFGHASKKKIGNLSMLAKLMIDKLSPTQKVVSVAQHVIGRSLPGTYKEFLYSHLSKKYLIDSHMIVFDQASPFYLYKDSSFDFIVVNPVVGNAGLASFRTANLKTLKLKFKLPRKNLYLCQYFPEAEIKEDNDFDRVVPAANSLVLQSQEISVIIPSGRYYKVIRNSKNRIISRRKVVVK